MSASCEKPSPHGSLLGSLSSALENADGPPVLVIALTEESATCSLKCGSPDGSGSDRTSEGASCSDSLAGKILRCRSQHGTCLSEHFVEESFLLD
jgi:hypothetical protein